MREFLRRLLIIAFIAAVILGGVALIFRPLTLTAPGVAMGKAVAPDLADKPLAMLIWYPTEDDQPDSIRTGKLPLIIISHGTGGNSAGYADTAIALARAGNVVAALNHTGDNTRDLSYVGGSKQLTGRPRHISRVLDFMLTSWPKRTSLDPGRIGMFGHSAGGFTAVTLAGGEPYLPSIAARCRAQPDEWSCQYVRKHGGNPDALAREGQVEWGHDPRIRAAVIAAPALGFTFVEKGLGQVKIPLQIWAAKHDAIVYDSPEVIDGLLSGEKEFHPVADAGHFSFLAPCGWQMKAIITMMSWFGTDRICDDPARFDRSKFHDRFNKDVVRFFAGTLSGAEP